MTIPNTSSGYGWQCPSCKTWVPAGQLHACSGYGSQYYTYQPYIDPAVLERIAKALESIASQLTNRQPATFKRRKMSNEELYEKALEAIKDLFSDMSVSQSDARANLESLKSEIDIMLDSLQNDEAG